MKKNLKKMLFSVYFLKSKDIYLYRAGEKCWQIPSKSLLNPYQRPFPDGSEGLSAGPGGKKEGETKN